MLFETTVSWPGAIWTQLNCLLVSNNTDAYRKGLWSLNGMFSPQGASGGRSGHEGDGRFAVTLSWIVRLLVVCTEGILLNVQQILFFSAGIKRSFCVHTHAFSCCAHCPIFFLRFYRKPTGTWFWVVGATFAWRSLQPVRKVDKKLIFWHRQGRKLWLT